MNTLKQMKDFPISDREETLQLAYSLHPEAETDVEAVDLLSQDLYKKIQEEMDSKPGNEQYDEIKYYGYLKFLLHELNNEEINKQSSFTIKPKGAA